MQKGAYTAGSAVVCFSSDRHGVLLLKPAYLSIWIFPGGFKDRKERPETTARRELREEVTALAELPLRLANLRIQTNSRHIDVVFFSIVPDDLRSDALRVTSREIRDARWFPLDEALQVLNDDGAEILLLALDALELSQLPSPTSGSDRGV